MIETIIFFIVLIVLALIVWKVLKSLLLIKVLFRVISILVLVFIVVIIISGYMVISDAKSFKEQFTTSDNLFLLMNNGTIIAGTEILNTSKGMMFRTLDSEDIESVQVSYDKYEFNDIEDDYYKIIVFNTESIDEIKSYAIEEFDVNLKSKDMKELLLSEDVSDDAKKLLAEAKDISYNDAAQIIDNVKEENIKGYFFSAVLAEYFHQSNTNTFLMSLKSQEIKVYAETAMFKAVKIVPKFLMKNILASNSTRSTTEAFFSNNSDETLS